MPDTPEDINGRLLGQVARLEAELDAALAELGRVRDRNAGLREALRELVSRLRRMVERHGTTDHDGEILAAAARALGDAPPPEVTEGDRARLRACGDAG